MHCDYQKEKKLRMTTSPRSSKITDEILGESWVELGPNGNCTSTTPDRITPLPFASGEEYLRLLREAQRESNQSSARVSLASSRRDSPRDSPKSPPNSPNTELNTEDEFKGVYINYLYKDGVVNLDGSSDWIWDWSSRPDQAPPKDWKFKHPKRKTYSIRHAKVGKNGLFSKEVLYTLFITNFISLLLGTGVGSSLSFLGALCNHLIYLQFQYPQKNCSIALFPNHSILLWKRVFTLRSFARRRLVRKSKVRKNIAGMYKSFLMIFSTLVSQMYLKCEVKKPDFRMYTLAQKIAYYFKAGEI